jgi:transcription elongation factor Elf1
MTSIESLHRFDCAARCVRCGQELVSPMLSEYINLLSEYINSNEIRQFFSCSNCDYEFEILIQVDAKSTLAPEITEQFLPSLLVA